jgi:Malectin domain
MSLLNPKLRAEFFLLTLLFFPALLTKSHPTCAEEIDPVVRLYLVDVGSGKDLYEVTEGGVLNIERLDGRAITIRAEILPTPREVVFDWNTMRRYRAETAAPYSLAGDVGGKYHPWAPKLGENTIAIRLNGSSDTVLKRSIRVVRTPGPHRAALWEGKEIKHAQIPESTAADDSDSDRASLRPEAVFPDEPSHRQSELRINCGGDGFYDREGREWSADSFGQGGSYGFKNYSDDYTGTAVFRNGRDSRGGALQYAIPVQPGGYEVLLHFMELYAAGSGRRVFDVFAEGKPLVTDLDVSERVGVGTPLSLTRFVNVIDGTLDLEFRSKIGLASVAAIEVLPRAGQ